MKKIIVLIVFLVISLFVIFNIDFRDGSRGVRFDFSDTDFLNGYDKSCFDDGIFYYGSSDISIISSDVEKLLFFYKISYEYEDGNLCLNEYILSDDTLNDIISSEEEISEVISDRTRISVDDVLLYEMNDDNYQEYYLDNYVVYLYNIDNYTVLKVVYPSDYREFAIFE